jgi:hypothetical protein
MLQQREAATEIHQSLKEHIEYYAVKEAMKEALIRARPSNVPVKRAVERHLAQSELGSRLANLAFSVKERLLLPYDGLPPSVSEQLWHIAVCCKPCCAGSCAEAWPEAALTPPEERSSPRRHVAWNMSTP